MDTLIVSLDKSALVEWTDELGVPRRNLLPLSLVDGKNVGDHADIDNPEAGIPFGADLYDMAASVVITGAQIMAALRKRGIWVASDLANRPQVAVSVMIELASLSLSDLNRRII